MIHVGITRIPAWSRRPASSDVFASLLRDRPNPGGALTIHELADSQILYFRCRASRDEIHATPNSNGVWDFRPDFLVIVINNISNINNNHKS